MESTLKSVYNEDWIRNYIKDKSVRENTIYMFNLVKAFMRNGDVVIDLGCGPGLLVDKLSRINDTTGLDFSEKNITFARINMKGTFIIQDIERLRLTQIYDIVIMSHVLEHFNNPSEIIEKVKTIMKPDAILVISVPNARAVNDSFWRKYLSLAVNTHTHKFLFTPDNLAQALKGFRDINIWTHTGDSVLMKCILMGMFRKMFGNNKPIYTPVTNFSTKRITDLIPSGLLKPFARLSEHNLMGEDIYCVGTK